MTRFIEERMGDVVLVYDTEEHRAYALDPERARTFAEAPSHRARRAVLLAALAAGLSISAPTVADACSRPGTVSRCHRGDFGKSCSTPDGRCGRCAFGECV